MILHRSTPVTILAVDGWLATVRYPDCRVRIVSWRVLRGSFGGAIEVGWEVWKLREADACGRRQRRMAI
jgi:hypothetical protein